MATAETLPRRVPISDAFFIEQEDELFQQCIRDMQALQDEVAASPPLPDEFFATLLSHFCSQKPLESLRAVWEALVDERHNRRPLPASQQQLAKLLRCASICCRMRPLALRMPALEVWWSTVRSENFLECVDDTLDELLITLFQNMCLAEEDFLKESPEVLEDPELVHLLKVRMREGLDFEEAKTTFTARQRAANALDELANELQERVLSRVLPEIRLRFAEESWELKESAALALGAVAPVIQPQSLNGEDLEVLLAACKASPGLLRCTATWASSRFVPQLMEASESMRSHFLGTMQRIFFNGLQDPNNKVKAAAASATCDLLERNWEELEKHQEWIFQEMQKGLQGLVCRGGVEALPALCDSIATMLEQPATKRLKTANGLLTELAAQLDSAGDANAACIFEALSAFARIGGKEFIDLCPTICRQALRIIHNGVHAAPGSATANAKVLETERGVQVCVASITGATLVCGQVSREMRGIELRQLASKSLNGRQCKLVVADQLLLDHLSLGELACTGTELQVTAIVVPTHDAVSASLDFLGIVAEASWAAVNVDIPWDQVLALTVDCMEEERKMTKDVHQSAYCLLGTMCHAGQEAFDVHLRQVVPQLPNVLSPGIRAVSNKSVCNNAVWAALEADRLLQSLPDAQLVPLAAALQDVVINKSPRISTNLKRMACTAWVFLAARVAEVARNLDAVLPTWVKDMSLSHDALDPKCWECLHTAACAQPHVLVKHFEALASAISYVTRAEGPQLEAIRPHFKGLMKLCKDTLGEDWEATLSALHPHLLRDLGV